MIYILCQREKEIKKKSITEPWILIEKKKTKKNSNHIKTSSRGEFHFAYMQTRSNKQLNLTIIPFSSSINISVFQEKLVGFQLI